MIIIGSIIGILLVVGMIILYRTYAFFEEKKEFNVIKGQIPEFSQEDVQLSWYIGDEKQTTPFPTKSGEYVGKSVTCEKGATAEWSNAIWGLVNINPSNNKKVYCSVVFENGNTIADNDVKASNVKCNSTIFGVEGKCTVDDMQVGDLVSYTPPTGTSGNIPTTWTGYDSAQTIHPEYNKLWRVIKKNADGTVDIISEYTSYESIYFYGKEGYRVFVDGLNNIANLYKNDAYIQSARHIGYNGQTGSLETTSPVITATGEPSPFEPTKKVGAANNNEKEGGGDMLFQYDIGLYKSDDGYYGSDSGLIYQVYKEKRGKNPNPLLAYKTNTDGTGSTSVGGYWLTSRILGVNGSGVWTISGWFLNAENRIVSSSYFWSSYDDSWPFCKPIRVVLTVKSEINVTEDNTSEEKWKIN